MPQLAVMLILMLITAITDNASAEDINRESAQRKESAESIINNTVIQLAPINIIGASPEPATTPNASTLEGRSLHLRQSDTLGQTLNEELGISNASFGPGVGIPVIRGLTGSRVRILQNGIGTHDGSSLSPDHALAIDTLFAHEIKVLRGPEIVRYGGNAIGGIVDVSDGRIPERRVRKTISGTAESRYDTNANGTHSAFTLNTGKDSIAFNLGGFFRDRNDIRIPGKAIDETFAAQQLGLTEITNVSGKIPNTDSKAIGGFTGISWLGDQAMAG
ncbi:MAG TPA: TonB-dependent receptor plug domain-containing protein, partial [Nitrosomonas sp.]|nr:TonB-dependent receptor plug domain-containing protein [Nitrosomonas sp.]